MKRILLYCMFFAMDVEAQHFEKLKPHPKVKPEMTLVKAYILIKEFAYACLILPWWLDIKKAKNAAVYCPYCNYELDSLQIYGCFVAMGDTKKISLLKKLLYRDKNNLLLKFLLKACLQEEFECPKCLDYHGWHAFSNRH